MKKISRLILDIIMILILAVGLFALIYPFASDAINDFLDEQIVRYHTQQINQQTKAATTKRKAQLEKNKKLAQGEGNPGQDPFTQKDIPQKLTPNYYQQHTIAVVNIPKINVKLPIFDHTNELFLKKGAALLEGTSYPTGGKSTHAVISAHRGLPEAKLFTDLPKLKLSDQFFIENVGETLAYEIDHIQVVEPIDIEVLDIALEKDYVTLVTCTPYMINSHRLLVRGQRIPFKKAMGKALQKNDHQRQLKFWLTVISCITILARMLSFLYLRIRSWKICNKEYDLLFAIYDPYGIPQVGLEAAVFSSNGKYPITRNGAALKSYTTREGKLFIPHMKGGRYQIKIGSLVFKVKVKKVSDKNFFLQKIVQNPTSYHVQTIAQSKEEPTKKAAEKLIVKAQG